MPPQVIGDLNSNIIEIDDEVMRDAHGIIHFEGSENVLRLGRPERLTYMDIRLQGNRNNFTIEDGLYVDRLTLFGASDSILLCGRGLRIIGTCRIMLPEPSRVIIGPECMFADGVDILTSDFHPIFDVETGERINKAKDIELGAHVWLGLRTTLLKGARIGANSVIGANAVVSKELPEGCIAVGNPVRVIRQGVTWRIPL
jgi:acetyltransferase-like isoleucine patch superfamily enzyme